MTSFKLISTLFSEILSFVISVIAHLGIKDVVRFGLCHFLVPAYVIYVPSSISTWGQYFTTPMPINGNCESL